VSEREAVVNFVEKEFLWRPTASTLEKIGDGRYVYRHITYPDQPDTAVEEIVIISVAPSEDGEFEIEISG